MLQLPYSHKHNWLLLSFSLVMPTALTHGKVGRNAYWSSQNIEKYKYSGNHNNDANSMFSDNHFRSCKNPSLCISLYKTLKKTKQLILPYLQTLY